MKIVRRSICKRIPPTFIIIALNIVAYIYTSAVGGNLVVTDRTAILRYGQVDYLVANGWYWQLLTSLFVHVDITHLLGNMFFLLIFGLRAEELFSIQGYLAIYFSGGLAGNLLTLLFDALLFDLSIISAGASGAIFGLFGACSIYIRKTSGQSIVGALLFSFFLIIMNSGRGVNNLAHLGGLAIGLILGYGLAKRQNQTTTYEHRYSYDW